MNQFMEPQVLSATRIEAYKAVEESLGKLGVKIELCQGVSFDMDGFTVFESSTDGTAKGIEIEDDHAIVFYRRYRYADSVEEARQRRAIALRQRSLVDAQEPAVS